MNWPNAQQNQVLPQAPAPQAPVYTEEQIYADVTAWVSISQKIEALKKDEEKLRLKLDASPLFDSTKEKGTQTAKFANGWSLKSKRTQYVKVENTNYEAAMAVMLLRNLGGQAADRADRVLKFTPSLSETVYRECSPEEKAILDPLITRKPGKPGLEIVPPKDPK